MRCDQCGSENTSSAMFCAMCGSAIGQGTGPSAVPSAADAGASTAGIGSPPPSGPVQVPPAESGWGIATSGIGEQPAASMPAPVPHPGGAMSPGAPVHASSQPHTGVINPGLDPAMMFRRPAQGTPFMQDELASWGARLVAFLLNGLLKYLLVAAFIGGSIGLALLLDPDAFSQGASGSDATDQGGALVALGLLLGFGVSPFLYDWLFIARSGAAPGHRAAGIVVLREDGSRLTTGQAAGRAGARFLVFGVAGSCLSGLTHLATAITIGVTDRKQGLHDMMCHSIVVRRDALDVRELGVGVPAATVPAAPVPAAGGPWIP